MAVLLSDTMKPSSTAVSTGQFMRGDAERGESNFAALAVRDARSEALAAAAVAPNRSPAPASAGNVKSIADGVSVRELLRFTSSARKLLACAARVSRPE